MISFPNAKVNLGLRILAKREDGYHDLESCFYPIPWCDSLEILEASTFSVNSYGLEVQGSAADNLCVKAYELLQADFDIPPVEIHLLKNIPMGAGLGGGSADGAFTLKMLSELFRLNLSPEKLETYALRLGSDCPFFIKNKPAIASGRGEKLEEYELDLEGYFLALANPSIHISTREAFAGATPSATHPSIAGILKNPISDWKGHLVNDFESSIFPTHPEIENIKRAMYQEGAIFSTMTGSGSTVYGIFEDTPENKDWKLLAL